MVECSQLPQYPSQLKSVRTIFHQTDVYIKYKTIPPSKYKQFKFIISVHTIFNPSSEQPRHGAVAEIRDVQRSRESAADSGPDIYALFYDVQNDQGFKKMLKPKIGTLVSRDLQ